MPLLIPNDGVITFTKNAANFVYRPDWSLQELYHACLVSLLQGCCRGEPGFICPVQKPTADEFSLDSELIKHFWAKGEGVQMAKSYPATQVRVDLKLSELADRKAIMLGPVEVLELFQTGQLALLRNDILACFGAQIKYTGMGICTYALVKYPSCNGVGLYVYSSLVKDDALCPAILLD